MRIDGTRFDALADDLDLAIGELVAAVGADPARWERARPGRWTVGEHAAHVDLTLHRTAEAFDGAERAWRAGTLPPPPARRGPLQSLFVGLVAGWGYMPRGARTAPWAVPAKRPDRPTVLGSLGREAARHRALGAPLEAGERDRLWIESPFRAGWHYRLPEMVRVHAVHVRHHARQIAEIADAG